jgi:hypothetical protein
MKMTGATPHLHFPPPLPSPHGRGERGRGERVRGHFQSSDQSRFSVLQVGAQIEQGVGTEEGFKVTFLASLRKRPKNFGSPYT